MRKLYLSLFSHEINSEVGHLQVTSLMGQYHEIFDHFFGLKNSTYEQAKTKKFAKPFMPVHVGPRTNLLSKKQWSKILWHCLFKWDTSIILIGP